MQYLKTLKIKGFKSIRDAEIEFRPLNVLIGANGAGKSNLISFFKLLKFTMFQHLAEFVGVSGGANSLLFYGGKTTPFLDVELQVGNVTYCVRLAHAAYDTLVFTEEKYCSTSDREKAEPIWSSLGAGHPESKLQAAANEAEERTRTLPRTKDPMWDLARLAATSEPIHLFRRIAVDLGLYQFNDTSPRSPIRQYHDADNTRGLNIDGSNLAPVLLRLAQEHPNHYRRIVDTIRLVAPFFDDFSLAPDKQANTNVIMLRWKAVDSLYEFGPSHLSDGTLRAMCLITLLLLPDEDSPPVVIIDEPELGLHPSAIHIISGLMKAAAQKRQVIIATQSAAMADHFEPEDIIVTELRTTGPHKQRESTFKRLGRDDLKDWLEDYTLGQLWDKNVFGGTP
jgi:predicted ATPase